MDDCCDSIRKINFWDWINNPNEVGLPRKDILIGDLFYIPPRGGGVVWFGVYDGNLTLHCGERVNPAYITGVRPAIKL